MLSPDILQSVRDDLGVSHQISRHLRLSPLRQPLVPPRLHLLTSRAEQPLGIGLRDNDNDDYNDDNDKIMMESHLDQAVPAD